MPTRRDVVATLTGTALGFTLGCRRSESGGLLASRSSSVSDDPVAGSDPLGGDDSADRNTKEDTMTQANQIDSPPSGRMPVVFVGHGSPMNVVEDNEWSRGFAALRDEMPRPRAILAISAHWFVGGTYLTAADRPRTIHDFSGFPRALFEVDYPAPGRVDLAQRVRGLLGEERASLSNDWGLDHGTWSVLRWMFPEADIPVVQLSIDRRLSPPAHFELGRSLTDLRDEGVLILSSGNVVHNLRDAFRQMQTGSNHTPEWAKRFDATVATIVRHHDSAGLVSLWPDNDDARLAHPSPDHFLPLLYAQAASDERDAVRFPVEGFDLGSISMRNIVFG